MPSPPSRWQAGTACAVPALSWSHQKFWPHALGRAASSWSQIVDRIHFQQRVELSAPEATAESRIVTSANSGPLANARRRSRWIRSALRRDQISENPSSPPLLVTSELIDVGAASFLTPRLDPCSPGVLWPRPTRRAAIRNHATSLAKSRLFRR